MCVCGTCERHVSAQTLSPQFEGKDTLSIFSADTTLGDVSREEEKCRESVLPHVACFLSGGERERHTHVCSSFS